MWRSLLSSWSLLVILRPIAASKTTALAEILALPLTPTQKIQRGVLKKMVPGLLDDTTTVDTRKMKKRLVA